MPDYVKVKIGDLFDIHPTKNYGLTNAKLFANTGKTPVIVNSSVNNGVGGYVDLKPTEKGNIITFSDTTTTDSIFYQPREFIGYSHVQGVYPLQPDKWTKEALLYAAVSFRKAAAGRFDYANKFNRTIAAELQITLPAENNHTLIKKDIDKINFDFMTSYILNLQTARKNKLRAYITFANLNSYVFSDGDAQFLTAHFENQEGFKEFKVGSLFKSDVGDFDIQQKHINGKGHYVVNSGITDTGVKGKSDIKAKIFPRNTITVDMFGYAFFRGYEYKMATHGHVFSLSLLKSQEMPREVGLYFVCQLQYLQQKFSYNNMLNWNKIKEDIIKLPINNDGTPDFNYMSKIINIKQKQSINNVLKWTGDD